MSEVTAPQAPPAKGPKGQSFLRRSAAPADTGSGRWARSAARSCVLLCLVAIFADVLAPFHFMDMTMVDRLQGPSSVLPAGHRPHRSRSSSAACCTGRGCRSAVGFAATTLSVVVSLLIGGVAGFVGGKLDLAVQRLVDAWMSFPGLLLLLTVMTIIGQGIPQIIGMLGLASGIGNSRVVRGAVIGIKANPYFEAARAIGSPSWRTLLRHVWPNITAPIIIIYSITIGWAIIAEASLSFLGFGLPPDVPSWGTMLSREGRQYMEMAPRLAMWPGVALTIVVYSLNMVATRCATCSTRGCAAAADQWAEVWAPAPPSERARRCRRSSGRAERMPHAYKAGTVEGSPMTRPTSSRLAPRVQYVRGLTSHIGMIYAVGSAYHRETDLARVLGTRAQGRAAAEGVVRDRNEC